MAAEHNAHLHGDQSYELLFIANPLPMWVFEIDSGRFLAVNAQACAHYGYSEEEFLAMTISDIRPPEESEHLNKVRSTGPSGHRHFGLWKHRTKNGALIDVEITSDDIVFRGKQARLVLVNDVSARMDLERRLAQSQKLEAIGQLTGGIAHDFNNLLTVIIGNADTLLEELHEQTQLMPLVEMIRAAGERGAELTNHLLAFARRQALEPKVVRPDELIDGLRKLLLRTLGESIELAVSHAADLSVVSVDPAQFESALLNLCLNARDAMPGGGQLMIETSNVLLDQHYAAQRADVTPGAYVRISVSDTGTGMSAEDAARAFDPFFTTKPRGKGTGLGLSMVYGFVKQSGGHVAIYSEPGHGTVVTLYLRQVRGTAEPSRPAEPADISGHGERILLVEDDDLVREHATRLLESMGYRVTTASNGPEALDLLRKGIACDLLFTDVIMPGGMTGTNLAELARGLRAGLRVLYTSGYTENAIVHHGRVDPGVNLLHKPYRRPELAVKIRAALSEEHFKGGS